MDFYCLNDSTVVLFLKHYSSVFIHSKSEAQELYKIRLRVEAEIYQKGDVIKGVGPVAWHNGQGNGLCVWASNTGDMQNAATICKDKIEFFNPAIFMRLQAIGLEYDSVNEGELDYLFTVKPPQEVLGEKTTLKIAEIATKNSPKGGDGERKVVFIAVIDVVEGKCTFKGILLLDSSLDNALVG